MQNLNNRLDMDPLSSHQMCTERDILHCKNQLVKAVMETLGLMQEHILILVLNNLLDSPNSLKLH